MLSPIYAHHITLPNMPRAANVLNSYNNHVTSEDQIRLLIVCNAYSEIEFHYYLLAYVYTVYIHSNTCTLAIDRNHISYC